MKLMPVLSVTMLLSFCCAVLTAQDNPFVEFTGKPLVSYCTQLEELLYTDIDRHDSDYVANRAAQLREAAQLTKDKKWALEADYFEITYRYLRGGLSLSDDEKQTELKRKDLADTYMGDLQKIIPQARKIKATDIELRAMYCLWKCYYDHLNFDMSFSYCRELDKALSGVTFEAFPYRTYYYIQIGEQYYHFEAYETAIQYYEKALESPVNDFTLNELSLLLNNMGLIYRNHLNDLEQSDSCFYRIMEMKPVNPELPFHGSNVTEKEIFTNQDLSELWAGIAKGNLGTNCYLRGAYDAAIPLLIYGMEKVVADGNVHNYPYAAGKAITLSEIYLSMSDFAAAKRYADKAFEFLDKSRKRNIYDETRDITYWIQYYNLMSRYCRMTDNAAEALLYADSSAVAQTRHTAVYNQRKLHYAEIQAKQLELEAETQRSKIYYRNLIVVYSFALLLLTLLTVLYRQYRQKHAAYHALVRKSQEWAQTAVEYESLKKPTGKKRNGANPDNGQSVDEVDRQLFERLQHLMLHDQLYRDETITIEKIAQRLKVNRSYLSRAVNSCTGDNFNAFVNEYRIREAVLMLTEMPDTFTIEGIGNAAGFNDRKTFYTAFKKKTGLSPSDFRKNIKL